GRPGTSPCNLPKATREPQNDTEPTIAPNSDETMTYAGSKLKPLVVLNSTQAISATAPPPTPLNSATICGIAVILTCLAAGMPTTVPSTTPSTINTQLPIPGISSVASTAMPIPAAAMRLPRTAVRGPVRPIRP